MKFTQPTLSGGELAPGLHGRVDTARYATSLARCKNFVTKPTGGAVKRSGTRYLGRTKYGDRFTRLMPFVFSTAVKYLIEAGDGYFRFWANGALVTHVPVPITSITNAATPVVTAAGHGMTTGDQVLLSGVTGMDRLDGRTYQVTVINPNSYSLDGENTTADPAYAGGATSAALVELPSPYTGDMVRDIKFTQSADVLFLAHPQVPTKELRRLSSIIFELRDFQFRRGPFRGFNTDEAAIMAVSGTQGTVQVTTNVDTFTAEMVGGLIYLEEKELRGIKPWSSAEKNIAIGALRRSDQKVYRVTAVASGGSAGTPYRITGATRPTHSTGRAWDGPGDIKNDGVNDYAVGAEWEFVYNVFGIVQITGFTNARQVTATVIERMPDSIIGTAPSPVNTWTFNGGPSSFSIPGATSDNPIDYVVTINGAPQQSNPNYPGGGGVGGGGGGNPRPGNNNEMGNIQLE